MLRFRLWEIPVAVRPTFWLMGLLLAAAVLWQEADRLAMVGPWLVILFVSVLGHELGHALVARRLGARATIRLHGTGGATAWSSEQPVSPMQRIAVAVAGSAVGLALGLTVWIFLRALPDVRESGLLGRSLVLFVQVNVFWGLLNWLPIRFLDGGHILTAALEILLGRRGPVVAAVAFPVILVGVGWLAWSNGYVLGGLMAAVALVLELVHGPTGRRPPAGRLG